MRKFDNPTQQDLPSGVENHKPDAIFSHFWEFCKKTLSRDDSNKADWDSILDAFSRESCHTLREVNRFYSFLKNVPLAVGIGRWIKSADPFWKEKYAKGMTSLIQKRLIPFINTQGENVTLNAFKVIGHETIIENIRCVKEWTPLETEELVQCYTHFSHHLAQDTLNFIPPALDPDRHRTSNRFIQYESFFHFVQKLSPRDALIAKLLYFGAPTIEQVLSLKRNAIQDSAICFKEKELVVPKHLIQDLRAYMKEKKGGDNRLVFSNIRGEEVKRAHLNHSFARACKKMKTEISITPGSLLRVKED